MILSMFAATPAEAHFISAIDTLPQSPACAEEAAAQRPAAKTIKAHKIFMALFPNFLCDGRYVSRQICQFHEYEAFRITVAERFSPPGRDHCRLAASLRPAD
jgi:hypothetical protein